MIEYCTPRVRPSRRNFPRRTNIFKYRVAVAPETCSSFSTMSLVMDGFVRAKTRIFSRFSSVFLRRTASPFAESPFTSRLYGSGVFSCGSLCIGLGVDASTVASGTTGCEALASSTAGSEGTSFRTSPGASSTAAGSETAGTSSPTGAVSGTASDTDSIAGSGAGASSVMGKLYQQSPHFHANEAICLPCPRGLFQAG